MKILAIDTSTEACSAAIFHDGEVTVRFRLAPQKHTELILPFCDEVLAESGVSLKQLDAIAFGRGPGSFTGVRIAAGVIQGIAFAHDLPVVPVSTLAAIANAVNRQTKSTNVMAMIDARMQEVYWGCYTFSDKVITLMGEEKVSRPIDVSISVMNNWTAAGSGWEKYGPDIRTRQQAHIEDCPDVIYPSAYDIALLAADAYSKGLAVTAEQAVPVYLRDQVTHSPAG